MSRFGGFDRISRPAVALASASSCAVVCAAVLGAPTTPMVAGAVGSAAVTAVLSARHTRAHRSRPGLLPPLPVGTAPSHVTITALRAREVATGQAVHSAA
ncbi:MAG: hypothetical protein M3O23_05785 [Actinomycetota bacterium]|nr:hypothetical protein [Actinomycetota bacterium]